MVWASLQGAVNIWSAAGRLPSLTYSSSSSSSLASWSPGSWGWNKGFEDCAGSGAEEQEQVWGVCVLGSSLALSSYWLEKGWAIDKTRILQAGITAKLGWSWGHHWAKWIRASHCTLCRVHVLRAYLKRERWGGGGGDTSVNINMDRQMYKDFREKNTTFDCFAEMCW